MPKCCVEVLAGNELARMSFPDTSAPGIVFNAKGLDEVIAALIKARVAVAPKRTDGEIAAHVSCAHHAEALWYFGATDEGKSSLAIFHPGAGWFGCILGDTGAKKLNEALQTHVCSRRLH